MTKLAIPQDIRELSRQRASEFHNLLKTRQPDEIVVGQIWSTFSSLELPNNLLFETNAPRLIVVLEGAGVPSDFWGTVTVAPISLNVSMATESDLIISGGSNPLGFEFMVEVWNETPTLKGHLKQYLGQLGNNFVAVLQTIYDSQLTDQDIPNRIKDWIGLRVMSDEDPRLSFQEMEIEAMTYLAEAATAALSLDVTTTEPVKEAQEQRRAFWNFKLFPVLKKRSEVLHPGLALAAGGIDESESCLVLNHEEETRFAFEVLNQRRKPYRVYISILMLSPLLEGQTCTVSIETPTGILKSLPTKLHLNDQIIVGEDMHFNRNSVQSVRVEIDQEADSYD